ncbi:DUF2892 domain-containing protein [Candidatus Saccharibacteria bacterium]|nr:MAG: DUF2892 domain-containing protein [Candidatus Saccharibacteria bacterium]
MEKFVDFASGKQGRSLRIVVGAVLVCVAVAGNKGTTAWVIGILGVLLILSGVLKVCLLNKLVGRPFNACPN